MPLPELLADPALELVSGSRPSLCSEEALAGLPEAVVERARWWERHIVEILTGRPPASVPGTRPRPEFDPTKQSLRQRELAKLAELQALGHEVSRNTLQRRRFAYERDGLLGVVDGRHNRRQPVFGRVDERVVAAVREAIDGETDLSTGTVQRLQRKVAKALVAVYGRDDAPAMPSQPTFYRLVKRLAEGRHTFGSARTRRSLSKQPDGPFGTITVARPGEVVEIDSTPLDVRVVLDDGLVDRVELTAMVDNATRSIAAAVLRPTTKGADASLLLARALTPEPMRPGWADALRMSRSVLPHRSLTSIDVRLADAAARPVIAPETIVCDHGKAYLSQTFRQACCTLGSSLQPAHPDTPTDKPKVERTLQSVGTLFAQHVAGYVGSSVERRGRHAEQDAAWPMVELQALLDEWIVAVWQNRPHEGLRDPLTPGKALTPNEKYAALVEVAGYVPVPLGADDYIELLPARWRTINQYGIRVNHRTYDAKALNPYRRQHSGVDDRGGQWEVHYDPYDVSRIWVRDHHNEEGWIAATWTHLRTSPVPFGDTLWRHAHAQARKNGAHNAREAEIAAIADDLMDRAAQGPVDRPKAERRLTGRTMAALNNRDWPRPADEPEELVPAPRAEAAESEEDDNDDVADVIPLPVFDARKEAQSWRL
ncbi:Mu transposase C-terminal domain-containing protein [Mycobacteroides abscessus]|uniref:Mu transposase C-terminal domain-containing protein n=2 Tax=Mycobacteroides abscessus TaxID=36809 RepID=UPI000515BCE5|nr:Mu transposase C-terminal domain-containing protein [Mycobacteroides abscessus]MDM2422522.1 Mu transposase C-terminal domain-containing protein [Mycobacteroides abscessus]MDM2424293.1 Mu transposase C-terminal domain-containing protein [Mycobacteroides abscessus]MDM2429525.1 Mu transposase C-terminal domain-containing protein [Mycobacteroides abscessus]MDM2434507.1 Mu transposase C-terminal domain-containing protein [Mycobacteroides abscessus]MDM2439788.1 Mu transposase C-terminal domain-co